MTKPPVELSMVLVDALRIPDRPPWGIAAFAVDSPQRGQASFGSGIEINGWVIGRDGPVRGVRTICGGRASRLYPLDVRRPDVAADYSEFGHSAVSGFSAWAAISPGASNGEIALEAVLDSGDVVTLTEASVAAQVAERSWPAGTLPVSAPDFVIIGAQRGGTTSLHAHLGAHPQVQAPATKELHYLTDRHERGLDWYLGQFPMALPPGEITGEATPYALFHPLAPERLRRIAPTAKLIALLRNPVDRAYSHYLHERASGFEALEFVDALEAESERLAGEEARIVADPSYVSERHKHASYLARGDYAPQLERWFDLFPRDQMLVLRSEDLYDHPAACTAQVAAFLGVAPELDVPFAVHNRSTGPPLEPALRQRPAAHFAPKNARLQQLLGWNPGWE